jgi:ABC-type transporter Mla MlaB component
MCILENIQYGSRGSRETVIIIDSQILDYCLLKQWQKGIRKEDYVDMRFDLTQVERMTTAAFALLLVMKRDLMRAGRNLHVQGLQGQPKALCKIL